MRKTLFAVMSIGVFSACGRTVTSAITEPASSERNDPVAYSKQIETLADKSTCASYAWKSRGRAPAGYVRGMALGFARSYCRMKSSGVSVGSALIMSEANTGNSSKDALAFYQSTFSTLNMDITDAGGEALRSLYVLGVGLGMRESAGKYCEGWDTSAGSGRMSSQAEAGLFQFSYDSIGADSHLRGLYDEYSANQSRCQTDVFAQGATCSAQSILGTGAGAVFQSFTKQCPAFAVEYAMTLLRVLRAHFGPINRREAEVVPACDSLLKSVQLLIESELEKSCEELL